MKKLILSAAVGVLLASPVLAQSYDPGLATFGKSPTMSSASEVSNGLSARAEVTKTKKAVRTKRVTPSRGLHPHSPEACGGGSAGYNEACSLR
jgi:hypothetical protein